MIPYGRQFIDDKDINEVAKVLKSDFITTGPKIKEFEEKFAAVVGVNYAVSVSSGTAALHVACLAAGLRLGDEFVTTPMTFAASANCGLYCGAKPVFVDINEQGLINEELIQSVLTERSKVIIPVHYTGLPCAMNEIKEIASNNSAILIEDACHALGSMYFGSKIGCCDRSDMAVFSFHPVKQITTGEGGMVTTNSQELYDKLRFLRTHGIVSEQGKFLNEPDGPWYTEMQMLGFNYRMTDIQATLGISQLDKLDQFIQRRRAIVKQYNEAFEDNPYFDTLVEKEGQYSAYHLYPILIKDEFKSRKKDIFIKLREAGLGVQVHYIPVYFHPYYQNLGYERGLCSLAEDFYQKVISIPLFPAMTNDNVATVIDTIFNVFQKFQ